MHAAHRSGKEVIDGFLSRPTAGRERPAIVLVHGYRGLDDGQRRNAPFCARRLRLSLAGSFFWENVSHAERLRVEKNFAGYSPRGAGHAFLNNPQGTSVANRESVAQSVVKLSKWLKEILV